MDYKEIRSQISNKSNNSIYISDDFYEDFSDISEINRSNMATIKFTSNGFPIIDPTEMVINKFFTSNQQSQREPFHRGLNNQELDPIPVNKIEKKIEKYRKKWSIILGFISFILPGSGQSLCNRVKPTLLFVLLSILCIAASYLTTYRVLISLLIIGIASGVDEYHAIKKHNYLPYFKKYWFIPILLIIIYAIGIYLILIKNSL